MNRIVLGAFLAFVFTLCAVVSIVAFSVSGEALFALFGVLFAFVAFGGIAMSLEETKMFDRIARMFAGEEASHE